MNDATNSTALRPGTSSCPVYTVGDWGLEWLVERESIGYRNVADDRRRWHKHVAQHAIERLPLMVVTETDAREWLHDLLIVKKRGKPLAANTCRNALNLLRASFTDACEAGVAHTNPFRTLRIPRARSARSDDPWTFLQVQEQRAFLRSIDEPVSRRLVAFAIGSGISQGEQWSLRRRDVVLDAATPHVTIVFGGGDRPALSARDVPLFGEALQAARAQLKTIGHDPDAYVWPALRGGPRDKKPPSRWREWLASAGITRPVRWHDLRHTCAASLVSGWWGRAWSLEEVKELLGHSSITITERYAHFAKNVLTSAARETAMAIAKGGLQ